MKLKKILFISILISLTCVSTVFATDNKDINNEYLSSSNIKNKIDTNSIYNFQSPVQIQYGEIISNANNILKFRDYDTDKEISIPYLAMDLKIIDSKTKSTGYLKLNEPVYIYTKLTNDKTVIQAIITNIENNASDASFIEVKSIEKIGDKIRVLDTNNSTYVSLDNNTKYSPYLTKQIVTSYDIVVGSKLIIWENVDENIPKTLQFPTEKIASDCIIINDEKDGWVQTNGDWSYYIQDMLVTGWYNDNGTWYYLDNDGIMKTGWIFDNSNWYFCLENGKMLSNITVDGYHLGLNGALI